MDARAWEPGLGSNDVLVIGGGQSGLAVGYHLQRLRRRNGAALDFEIIDDRAAAGGAWQDGWQSLRLFSPAAYSSLAGWQMPPYPGEGTPTAAHVRDYLAAYESRYQLPVRRGVTATGVGEDPAGPGRLLVTTTGGAFSVRAVVNATGTWRRPFWPNVPGARDFRGRQLHTADYRSPDPFSGQRVLVVGGGNSGAQIAADLLPAAEMVLWVTQRPPRYLPDDVDGRVLFETATRAVQARAAGREATGVAGLGDIVAVPSVRAARDRGDLRAQPMIARLTPEGAEWPDGRREALDAVIWCTGFRPALRHLRGLHLGRPDGYPATTVPVAEAPGAVSPVTSVDDPRILFVGYGDWCGPASATLIGVNRSARDAAAAVFGMLRPG